MWGDVALSVAMHASLRHSANVNFHSGPGRNPGAKRSCRMYAGRAATPLRRDWRCPSAPPTSTKSSPPVQSAERGFDCALESGRHHRQLQ